MATKSTTTKPPASRQKKTSGSSVKKAPTAKKTAAKTKKPQAKKPTFEEVSSKAYEIYLERVNNGEAGDPVNDWHKALVALKA